MKLSFQWRSDFSGIGRVERAMDELMQREERKIATHLMNEVKENWSPKSPSSAGTPPAVKTGAYNESIQIIQNRGAGGRFERGWSVRFNTDKAGRSYSEALEFGTYKMAARPHIRPAIERTRNVFKGLQVTYE